MGTELLVDSYMADLGILQPLGSSNGILELQEGESTQP